MRMSIFLLYCIIMKKLFSIILFFAIVITPACEGTFAADEPVFETYEPVIFAASDVSQAHIDETIKWFNRAKQAWFKKDSPAFQKFSPLYLAIIGTDVDAAKKLNKEFCNYQDHINNKCNDNNGNTNVFQEYALEGNAAVTSIRARDGYHLLIMSSSRPSPFELDYAYIVFHELFHTYQKSYQALIEMDPKKHTFDFSKQISGKKTGGKNNTVWWSEGTANYLAQLLYAKQPEAESDFLKEQMRMWLERDNRNPGISVKEEYLLSDIKLYEYEYGDKAYIARYIGDWFIAYLVKDFGEKSIFDFYAQLPIIGNWDETFTTIFKKPYTVLVDEFDEWLQQPNEELLKIIP